MENRETRTLADPGRAVEPMAREQEKKKRRASALPKVYQEGKKEQGRVKGKPKNRNPRAAAFTL